MKRFWHNNSLSIVLTALFLLFWLAQALSGWATYNEEQGQLKQQAVAFLPYLTSAHFWSTTAENWESEFLQMGAYVVLTIHLRQRGSAESKPYPEEETPEERAQDEQDATVRGFWKRNGLSVALFGLFLGAFALHMNGSWKDYNHEQLARGQEALSLGAFLRGPEFWFESFQNWQSEFLAVVAIVVLTISLRQVGSSQSKGLTVPNEKTGD